MTKYHAVYLVSNYGKATDEILDSMKALNHEDPEISMIQAELIYCLDNEMVFTLADFYIRRTGRLYFDIHSIVPSIAVVANHFQEYFSWSNERVEQEKADITSAIHEVSKFE